MVQKVLLIGLVMCSFLVPPLGLKARACSLAIYILCLVLAFYSWEAAPSLGLVHIPSPLQHATPFFGLFAFSNYKTGTLIVQAPFLPITSPNVPQGTNCTRQCLFVLFINIAFFLTPQHSWAQTLIHTHCQEKLMHCWMASRPPDPVHIMSLLHYTEGERFFFAPFTMPTPTGLPVCPAKGSLRAVFMSYIIATMI